MLDGNKDCNVLRVSGTNKPEIKKVVVLVRSFAFIHM